MGSVSNYRPDGILGADAGSFHIDFGFFEQPPLFLSLYGLEVPASGTETWFASGIAAARSLPAALRKRLGGLTARHIFGPDGNFDTVRVRKGRLDARYPHALRPVLWPHRDTDEPILGVWEQATDAPLPLDPAESDALIEELFAHLYRAEHRSAHRWTEGDLLIWDNHAIQHGRPAPGTETHRTLRRVAVGETQDVSRMALVSPDRVTRNAPSPRSQQPGP